MPGSKAVISPASSAEAVEAAKSFSDIRGRAADPSVSSSGGVSSSEASSASSAGGAALSTGRAGKDGGTDGTGEVAGVARGGAERSDLFLDEFRKKSQLGGDLGALEVVPAKDP